MRILLIHIESQYFGGAEKMLGYFLSALPNPEAFVVACVQGSKVAAIVPPTVRKIALKNSSRTSIVKIIEQAWTLRKASCDFSFNLVHGWAARDWELASVLGWVGRRPVLGTLHDHPLSTYLTRSRQRLMHHCANYGLDKIVCVSSAVRDACVLAGYQRRKLAVIRNGLSGSITKNHKRQGTQIKLGYIGGFQENKGFAGVFEILRSLTVRGFSAWKLVVAGGAREARDNALLSQITSKYCRDPWWSSIEWVGWVEDPVEFMVSLDLLIFPSTAFDSFPNVLLESGLVGLPVVASNVGGVSEIVRDGVNGWLFAPHDWSRAAEIIAYALTHPEEIKKCGENAQRLVAGSFTVEKMVAQYRAVYASIAADV